MIRFILRYLSYDFIWKAARECAELEQLIALARLLALVQCNSCNELLESYTFISARFCEFEVYLLYSKICYKTLYQHLNYLSLAPDRLGSSCYPNFRTAKMHP